MDLNVRLKFINQNVEPYEKTINHVDELNEGEKVEFLEIFLRLKKGFHRNKKVFNK